MFGGMGMGLQGRQALLLQHAAMPALPAQAGPSWHSRKDDGAKGVENREQFVNAAHCNAADVAPVGAVCSAAGLRAGPDECAAKPIIGAAGLLIAVASRAQSSPKQRAIPIRRVLHSAQQPSGPAASQHARAALTLSHVVGAEHHADDGVCRGTWEWQQGQN